jgi:hypothetical protein
VRTVLIAFGLVLLPVQSGTAAMSWPSGIRSIPDSQNSASTFSTSAAAC